MNPTGLCLCVMLALTVSCSHKSGDTESLHHPYATAESIPEPRIFASGVVSTANPEFGTSFSRDGRTVYFNWASQDRGVLKIMQSTFVDGKWGQPEALLFSDGNYRDVDPFVALDGERIYFSSNRPLSGAEANDNFDIWYVQKTDAGWSEPANSGAPLNGPGHEIFVSVTAGGTLYFRSEDWRPVRRHLQSCPLKQRFW